MSEEEKKSGNFLGKLGSIFFTSLEIPTIGIIAALLLGAVGGVFVVKARPQILGLSKSQAELQKEVDSLVKEVEKLINLPEEEAPTIATVTDVEKVKDQPFFKDAQNGDKVLIYTNARKAILYRPGENRIVEVGAVNINQGEEEGVEEGGEEGEESPSPTPSPEPDEEEEAVEEESPSPSPEEEEEE